MIDGVKWTVKEKQRVRHEDGEIVDGQCIYETKTFEICIASGDEKKILATYFHEVFHALTDSCAVVLTEGQEHSLIASFERWMTANTILKPKKTPKVKTTQEKAEDVTN